MRALSLASLLLACSACGSSDPKMLTDQGVAALDSGDPETAVEKFVDALSRMPPEHPDFLRAWVTRCRALARLEPDRAAREFLELAERLPGRIREQDFAAVAGELVAKGAVKEAVRLAEVGMKTFPQSPAMKTLRDSGGEAAKKAKDPESLRRLQGLGYTGGDG